jgi:hypothetical protein
MTPITVLMNHIQRKPLHEKIHLLRMYLKFEKKDSDRYKEIYNELRFLMIRQLNREDSAA